MENKLSYVIIAMFGLVDYYVLMPLSVLRQPNEHLAQLLLVMYDAPIIAHC